MVKQTDAGARASLIILGAVLWVMGVVGIHLATPIGVFAPGLSWLALLVGFALAAATVRLAGRLRMPGMSLVEAVGLVALPASMLDGMVLTWAPWVYAADAADQRAVGAWLLWFVGTSLAVALTLPGRRRKAAP